MPIGLTIEHNEFKKPLENVPMAYLQLDTGVDPIYRNIYWDDTITEMLPFFIKQRINLIMQQSNDETTPINLYLNSKGGEVYQAFGVIDVMKTATMPINVIGTGCIMSAAVLIIMSATGKKLAYNSTRFMVHQVWGGGEGKLADLEITAAEMKLLQNTVFDIFAKETKQPDIKFWRKFGDKSDKYFDAKYAKELGIIDDLC